MKNHIEAPIPVIKHLAHTGFCSRNESLPRRPQLSLSLTEDRAPNGAAETSSYTYIFGETEVGY